MPYTAAPSTSNPSDINSAVEQTKNQLVAALSRHAKLDSSTGFVQANLLPAGLDDVQEFANLSSFPTTGVSSIIYVAVDTNKTYRWGGTSYVLVSGSGTSFSVATTTTDGLMSAADKAAWDSMYKISGIGSNLALVGGVLKSNVAVNGGGVTTVANVQSLLHMDGTDGGQTFIDEFGKTWTPTGAVLSATQKKFGTTSLALLAAGHKLISPASDWTALNGTNKYTIEAFVYPTQRNTYSVIFTAQSVAAGPAGLFFAINNSGYLVYQANTLNTTTYLVPLNTWTHFFIKQDGASISIFANGNLVASYSNGSTINTSYGVGIGNFPTTSDPLYQFYGYIDEVRVTTPGTIFAVPTVAYTE